MSSATNKYTVKELKRRHKTLCKVHDISNRQVKGYFTMKSSKRLQIGYGLNEKTARDLLRYTDLKDDTWNEDTEFYFNSLLGWFYDVDAVEEFEKNEKQRKQREVITKLQLKAKENQPLTNNKKDDLSKLWAPSTSEPNKLSRISTNNQTKDLDKLWKTATNRRDEPLPKREEIWRRPTGDIKPIRPEKSTVYNYKYKEQEKEQEKSLGFFGWVSVVTIARCLIGF